MGSSIVKKTFVKRFLIYIPKEAHGRIFVTGGRYSRDKCWPKNSFLARQACSYSMLQALRGRGAPLHSLQLKSLKRNFLPSWVNSCIKGSGPPQRPLSLRGIRRHGCHKRRSNSMLSRRSSCGPSDMPWPHGHPDTWRGLPWQDANKVALTPELLDDLDKEAPSKIIRLLENSRCNA